MKSMSRFLDPLAVVCVTRGPSVTTDNFESMIPTAAVLALIVRSGTEKILNRSFLKSSYQTPCPWALPSSQPPQNVPPSSKSNRPPPDDILHYYL